MPPSSLARPFIAPLAGLVALVSLGAAGVARAADPMPVDTGNTAHDLLARMTPGERNRSLDRVLRSVGHADCDVAQSAFLAYRSGHDATWRATCTDGRHFLIELRDGNDSTLSVTACGTAADTKARCEP